MAPWCGRCIEYDMRSDSYIECTRCCNGSVNGKKLNVEDVHRDSTLGDQSCTYIGITGIIAVVIAATGIVVFVSIMIYYCCRKKRNLIRQNQTAGNNTSIVVFPNRLRNMNEVVTTQSTDHHGIHIPPMDVIDLHTKNQKEDNPSLP